MRTTSTAAERPSRSDNKLPASFFAENSADLLLRKVTPPAAPGVLSAPSSLPQSSSRRPSRPSAPRPLSLAAVYFKVFARSFVSVLLSTGLLLLLSHSLLHGLSLLHLTRAVTTLPPASLDALLSELFVLPPLPRANQSLVAGLPLSPPPRAVDGAETGRGAHLLSALSRCRANRDAVVKALRGAPALPDAAEGEAEEELYARAFVEGVLKPSGALYATREREGEHDEGRDEQQDWPDLAMYSNVATLCQWFDWVEEAPAACAAEEEGGEKACSGGGGGGGGADGRLLAALTGRRAKGLARRSLALAAEAVRAVTPTRIYEALVFPPVRPTTAMYWGVGYNTSPLNLFFGHPSAPFFAAVLPSVFPLPGAVAEYLVSLPTASLPLAIARAAAASASSHTSVSSSSSFSPPPLLALGASLPAHFGGSVVACSFMHYLGSGRALPAFPRRRPAEPDERGAGVDDDASSLRSRLAAYLPHLLEFFNPGLDFISKCASYPKGAYDYVEGRWETLKESVSGGDVGEIAGALRADAEGKSNEEEGGKRGRNFMFWKNNKKEDTKEKVDEKKTNGEEGNEEIAVVGLGVGDGGERESPRFWLPSLIVRPNLYPPPSIPLESSAFPFALAYLRPFLRSLVLTAVHTVLLVFVPTMVKLNHLPAFAACFFMLPLMMYAPGFYTAAIGTREGGRGAYAFDPTLGYAMRYVGRGREELPVWETAELFGGMAGGALAGVALVVFFPE